MRIQYLLKKITDSQIKACEYLTPMIKSCPSIISLAQCFFFLFIMFKKTDKGNQQLIDMHKQWHNISLQYESLVGISLDLCEITGTVSFKGTFLLHNVLSHDRRWIQHVALESQISKLFA